MVGLPGPGPRQSAASLDRFGQHSSAGVAGLSDLAGKSFFRAHEAAELGVHSRALRRLANDGSVERVARGLYRLAEAELTEHYTHAAVCARVPRAIVCLLTALCIYEIGTQLPRDVWIAIPHKARTPRIPELPVRVVRFSGASLLYGVEKTVFEGVPARITSPARTVVDCFRFRRLVGMDVALEALRDALRERKASPDEVWQRPRFAAQSRSSARFSTRCQCGPADGGHGRRHPATRPEPRSASRLLLTDG